MNNQNREAQSLGGKPVQILLVGNYPFDRQESMLRFANILLESLHSRQVETSLIFPQPFLGQLKEGANGVGKWLGYFDKFVVFPFLLRKAVQSAAKRNPSLPVVVHICDHSNAFYAGHVSVPVAVTCHDLLAVLGALGEQTDCPASRTGQILQQWILAGLAKATALVCDSTATKDDVERLVANGKAKAKLVLLGLNHHFQVLPIQECNRRLVKLPKLPASYILHVGSNLRRKNREGVLRIFSRLSRDWQGGLVLAGPPLTPELTALAKELGVAERLTVVVGPSDDELEALYNQTLALLFPSRFEGFGWPIIEAQACGAPVVCSACGPLPEVVGEGGLVHDLDDEEGMAASLMQLTDPATRERYVRKSLANIARFTTDRMIDEYIQIYQELAAK